MTLPGKNLFQNWWRNQKLFRQEVVKRIQYYQNSFTRNVKGTFIVKKYKRKKKKKERKKYKRRKRSTKSNPKELRKWQ